MATVALGLANTFCRVLLKNWNDKATWCASTYSTWEMKQTLGTPSGEQVQSALGAMFSKLSRMSSSVIPPLPSAYPQQAQASDRKHQLALSQGQPRRLCRD